MNQAPLLLISLSVGSAMLLAGGVLWVMAGRVTPPPLDEEPRPKGILGAFIALTMAWVGSLSQCLLAFLIFGVSLDMSRYKDNMASVLLVAGFVNSLIVGLMTLNLMRRGFVPRPESTPRRRPFLIAYSTVTALSLATYATCFWMAFLSNYYPFLNEDSTALLFASIAAFVVGWTAVAYQEQRKTTTLVGYVPLYRRTSLLLRIAAIILIIWGVICWGWLVIIPGIIWVLVIWSSLAARNRAAELTTLWTLSISSESGPLQGPQVWQHMSRVQGPAQRRLKRLAAVLGDGEPLDLALQRCRIIPRSCSMEVQAALDADRLSEALRSAAARETKRFAQGPDVTEAFSISYFALIVNVAMFIVGFLMYFIIPKFKKIFEDFGTELPQLTMLLIRISDAFVNYWYLFMPILIPATFFAFRCDMQARFYGWRAVFERLFGSTWPRLRSPDLLRGLAWGIRGGRPLVESFAAMTLGQATLTTRQRIRHVAEQVRNGEDPWVVLTQHGWLNTAECEALQRAQSVGNLPWVLDTLADADEQRWDRKMSYRLQFVRPALITVLGLAVAFIAIAMFMPLVKLLNDLS